MDSRASSRARARGSAISLLQIERARSPDLALSWWSDEEESVLGLLGRRLFRFRGLVSRLRGGLGRGLVSRLRGGLGRGLLGGPRSLGRSLGGGLRRSLSRGLRRGLGRSLRRSLSRGLRRGLGSRLRGDLGSL